MSGKPTPSSVSAYLGKNFPRSQRCGPTRTPGFAVRAPFDPSNKDGYVAVEHEPGSRIRRSGTWDGILRLQQAELTEYQAHLEQRYRVTRNDEGGADDWNTLLVWPRDEKS